MDLSRLSMACGLMLPLALGPVGCHSEGSGESAGAPSTSVSAAGSAVASASVALPRRPPIRHHSGLAAIVLRPAYDLPTLTDDQRQAIEKLEPTTIDAGTPEAPTPMVAHRAFQVDLVAGIRATKLDTTKLQADYGVLDKAATAALAHEAEALDGLHGILSAAQRQELVDQVKAKRAAHPLPPMAAPDGGAIDWHKRKLDRYAVELALDDGQKKQVAALIAKEPTTATVQARRDATQKRVDTLLAEFTKDPFDAKKLDLSMGGGKTPHDAEEAQAAFVGGLLPLLHPDQREKLAVRTERGGTRPGRGGDDMDMALPFGVDDDMGAASRLR